MKSRREPAFLVLLQDSLGDCPSGIEARLSWIMSLRNNPANWGTETVSFEFPGGSTMEKSASAGFSCALAGQSGRLSVRNRSPIEQDYELAK